MDQRLAIVPEVNCCTAHSADRHGRRAGGFEGFEGTYGMPFLRPQWSRSQKSAYSGHPQNPQNQVLKVLKVAMGAVFLRLGSVAVQGMDSS